MTAPTAIRRSDEAAAMLAVKRRRAVEPSFVVFALLFVGLVGAVAGAAPLVAVGFASAALVGARLVARPDLATLSVIALIYSNAAVVGVRIHGVPETVQYLVPLLLSVPLAERILRRREPLVAARALPFATAFLAVQIISALASRDPGLSIETVEVSALEGIGLFVLVTNAIPSVTVLRRAVWVVVLVGAALGTLSILQAATGAYDEQFLGFAQPGEAAPPAKDDVFAPKPAKRLGGPIGEKNRYAQVLLLAAPLAAMLARVETDRRNRVLALASTGLILGGVVLTFSRGAALATVAIAITAVLLRELRLRQLVLPAIAAVLVLTAVPDYRARLSTISAVTTATDKTVNEDEGDGSIRSRVTENIAALLVFADHPVIGVGPGLFPTYYGDYAQRVGIRIKNAEREAHNLYLDIAADMGALGLLAFLGVNLVTVRDLLRSRRRAVDPHLRALATGLVLSLTGYLVTGIFLHFSFVRYFWLLLGLAGAATVLQAREGEVTP